MLRKKLKHDHKEKEHNKLEYTLVVMTLSVIGNVIDYISKVIVI